MPDPTWLFLSLLPSGAGFVLFVYGKKLGRWPHALAGVALMAYPYFTSTVAGMCGGAAVIMLAWYLAIRGGW
jgi:hypothetical protein